MSKDRREELCFACSYFRIAKPFSNETFSYCAAYGESVDMFLPDIIHGPCMSPAVSACFRGEMCDRFEPRSPKVDITQDFEGALRLLEYFKPV